MQHGEAQAALAALGMDAICQAIQDGKSMRDISASVGVSVGSLAAWLAADPERSARAREARRITAQIHEEDAARAIEEAKDMFELARAREIAQHKRWRASKIDPKNYGDKLELAGDKESPLTVVIQQLTPDA